MLPNGMNPSRQINLVGLLNLNDPTLKNNLETVEFINYVSNNSNKVFLSYRDSNWYAIAHCTFMYRSKKNQIDIILKTEYFGKGYRWIISSIKSDIFSLSKGKECATNFINPINHEIGFSELSKAINNKNNIYCYTSDRYNIDLLSVFLVMIRNGDLKLTQINSIEFQFFQVGDWMFTVKNFNRADLNSGWLISHLTKMDEKQKEYYKKNNSLN